MFRLILFSAVVALAGCTPKYKAVLNETGVSNEAIAFPGADGFGKYTTGGRGGKVFIVSNLNDAGPGSFREAAMAKGKRIIVFTVDGTIHLDTKLSIRGDVTIAGQTAPGDGICLADNSVQLSGDNIIVRYLRFRMGDKFQKGGMVDGNGGDDAFGGTHHKNVIIDHCSMSWSTDEAFSVYAGDSTTLQWNIIAEPLNYSYHFETGDKDYEHHGFGGIWGGRHLSAHHNLFAHCNNRNPRFDGIRNAPEENVDYCNNVIYNWGQNTVYAGEGGNYNIVNNYYRYGPSTNVNARARVMNPYSKPPAISFGKFYITGNFVDGSTDVSADNWKGVLLEKGTAADREHAVAGQPVFAQSLVIQNAADAYEAVLQKAGASFKRDTLDQRIIEDVKQRRGKFIDVQGGFPHGTEYVLTTKAWPFLQAGKAAMDSDSDGIPDQWEQDHGVNANDKNDAALTTLDKHYSNIEVYINGLVK